MSRRVWKMNTNKVTCQEEFEDEYKIKLHVKKSLKMNTK